MEDFKVKVKVELTDNFQLVDFSLLAITSPKSSEVATIGSSLESRDLISKMWKNCRIESRRRRRRKDDRSFEVLSVG